MASDGIYLGGICLCIKMLEDELLVQETMSDRAIVWKDIYNTRLKINELVRELTD